MEGLLDFDIHEYKSMVAFTESKVITLQADVSDEDNIVEELVIKTDNVYTTDESPEVYWDNTEWIVNDLVEHLFGGGDYPSVTEAFKEGEFSEEEIYALKHVLVKAAQKGFFTSNSIIPKSL